MAGGGSTLGGLLLIIEPWNMQTSLASKLLSAALCWAVVLTTSACARCRHRPLVLTAVVMIFGTPLLLMMEFAGPGHRVDARLPADAQLSSVASIALCWWLRG